MLTEQLRLIPGSAKASVAFALIPLVVSLSYHEQIQLNGVANCSTLDFAALGFGLAAVVFGFFALSDLHKARRYDAGRTYAAAGLGMALGGAQLVLALQAGFTMSVC